MAYRSFPEQCLQNVGHHIGASGHPGACSSGRTGMQKGLQVQQQIFSTPAASCLLHRAGADVLAQVGML